MPFTSENLNAFKNHNHNLLRFPELRDLSKQANSVPLSEAAIYVKTMPFSDTVIDN
jgi:hypothetical protein